MQKQKRLLVITERWYPDTFGGSERLVFEQVRGFSDAGFLVDVFVATNLAALPRVERLTDTITIHRAPAAVSIPGNQLYSINLQSRAPLSKLLTAMSYDALLCHHPQIGALAVHFRAGTKNMHTPLIYFFHSSQGQEIRVDGPNRSYPGKTTWNEFVAQYVDRKERVILEAADHVFVFSQFSSLLLQKLDAAAWEHSTVLHPGIETDLYDAIFEKRQTAQHNKTSGASIPTRLFTVRRLTKRMGLHMLIQALGSHASSGSFELRIAGTGPMEQELRALAARFPNLHVEFLGKISMKELSEEFVRADLFVLPTIALEGFGIATLEALLSGVPVIATNAGATPELLHDINPQLIADDATEQALWNQLSWFHELPKTERVQLGKRCRAIALKKYSREKMNQTIVATIKKLQH